MRLVKIVIAAFAALSFSVGAVQYKLQDDAPVYWAERDALNKYVVKSGECLVLSRIGDSPSQYSYQVKQLLSKFKDDHTRAYVPLVTYSCMISGDPSYAFFIPEHYADLLP